MPSLKAQLLNYPPESVFDRHNWLVSPDGVRLKETVYNDYINRLKNGEQIHHAELWYGEEGKVKGLRLYYLDEYGEKVSQDITEEWKS